MAAVNDRSRGHQKAGNFIPGSYAEVKEVLHEPAPLPFQSEV
jgi:hypothetical protein